MEIRVKKIIDDIILMNDLDKDVAMKLEIFNEEQLHVIEEMLLYNVNLIDYFAAHNDYNADQMYEIFDGAKSGLDYTHYLDREYNYLQMRIIKFGLQMGVDISKYADFRFSWDQMYQIYWGLVEGINVDNYADYGLSVYEMIRIRKELMSAA